VVPVRSGSRLGRRALVFIAFTAWLILATVSAGGHRTSAEYVSPAPPAEPVSMPAVETARLRGETWLETGSKELSDLLYSTGARLALNGWEPEIIPYSCAIRISPAPDEMVWYRVSGENLLAKKPGPVRVLLVAAVDSVFSNPHLSSPARLVYPEDMILYLAQALSESNLEGIGFALVSSSFQGHAGLESLMRKADLRECRVLVLERASASVVAGTFLRSLLPDSPTPGSDARVVWYPDTSDDAARRYASRLATQLEKGILTSPAVQAGKESLVLLGESLYSVKTSFLKWVGAGSVALSLISLIASQAGRSHLCESDGLLTLVSFLCWPLLPLLAPAAYVRLTGRQPLGTGAVRMTVTTSVLVLFSWYLAGRRFDRNSGDLLPASRKARRFSNPPDPRPFACLFLSGLVIGGILSLPSGETRVSPLPQYVLALLGFLLSFFISALRSRESGLLEATLACASTVPAVILPDTPWGWMGVQRYAFSLARPDRAALIPFLVASTAACEALRTTKLGRGRHTKRLPRHISLLAATLVFTALTTLAWVLPGSAPEEKVLMERVFSFRCVYEASAGIFPEVTPDPQVALVRYNRGDRSASSTVASLYPVCAELKDFTHRWADVNLSYTVKEVSRDSVVLEIYLTASLLKPPTFLKVTFENVSPSSLSAERREQLQVDGTDFLGIPERARCEMGRSTSFVRWHPYEPRITSVFAVQMPAEAAIRVRAQVVYIGQTYSLSFGDAGLPPSPWTAVLSSWEQTLDIP